MYGPARETRATGLFNSAAMGIAMSTYCIIVLIGPKLRAETGAHFHDNMIKRFPVNVPVRRPLK